MSWTSCVPFGFSILASSRRITFWARLLAGIAQHAELESTWIFKGGTCLRKCYYETFRFSEDLDFTVIDGGPEEPDDLQRIFGQIAEWLREESGFKLLLDAKAFERRHNRRGRPTTQGRIAYRGPNPTRGVPPKVKFDLTSDEVLTQRPELRPIGHQYSDRPLPVRGVQSYPITELFGEKLRALAERCRPRDLYDVVYLHRHPDLIGRASAVADVLSSKAAHAGIAVPTLASLQETPFRTEIETEWENMLGHQLPRPLPPFASFWAALEEVFAWLGGRPTQQLPRAQSADVDPNAPDWSATQPITSWRRRAPILAPALRRRQPTKGRGRLPPRTRAQRPSRSRALLATPHPRRQRRAVRRQRSRVAPHLPCRPHRRHSTHDPNVRTALPRGVLTSRSGWMTVAPLSDDPSHIPRPGRDPSSTEPGSAAASYGIECHRTRRFPARWKAATTGGTARGLNRVMRSATPDTIARGGDVQRSCNTTPESNRRNQPDQQAEAP